MTLSVLVSTDDAAVIITLSHILSSRGYDYVIEPRLSKSFLKLLESDWNIFVLDVDSIDKACLDSIKLIQQMRPDVALIVLLKRSDINFIRKLSQLGIYYYIIKPIPNGEIEQVFYGLERFIPAKIHERSRHTVMNGSMLSFV